MTGEERAIWERLAHEQPILDVKAAPFGWDAWQRAHADGSSVMIARRDGQPVAVAALAAHPSWRRQLNPAGDVHWRCSYPITGRDVTGGIRALLEDLAAGDGWDELVLGPMIATSPTLDAIVAEGGALGMRPLVAETGRAYRTVFAGTWDYFYAARSGNLRSMVARGERRLGDVTLEEHRDIAQLETFFKLEASGWKGREGSAINSDPVLRTLYLELARDAEARGAFRLYLLRAGADYIAGDYCIEHEGEVFMLKTGYDVTQAKASPGQVLHKRVLAHLWATRDVRAFDYMPGGGDHADYKQRWANDVRAYAEVRLFRPDSARGQLLAGMLRIKRAVANYLQRGVEAEDRP